MKNCTKCDFKTKHNEYKICPICGERLELFKGKQTFTMGVSGEDSFETEIEMTYEEA